MQGAELPRRVITKPDECPVSELAKWKLDLEEWASENNGEALEIAKETCHALNSKTVNVKLKGDDVKPGKLAEYQRAVERKVFKAIAAGSKAFGSSDGIARYLTEQAQSFKSKVEEGDSTFHTRSAYLKAAQKARRLSAELEATGVKLDMHKYVEALEAMSEVELATPSNQTIDALKDVEAEQAAFAQFSTCVKALVACFPKGEPGVVQAKAMMSKCLDPMHDKVRIKLGTLCEQWFKCPETG